MEQSVRFWDGIAGKYAKKKIDDPGAYQEKLALTQQYFSPASSVLEFGCGTGSTALVHAEHVKNVVAIDFSQKMIDIAKQKAELAGVKNVEFLKATLFELSYPPESFDAVLGLSVLHLVDELEETIQKSYELLKPGGVFVTSTFCLAEKATIWRGIISVMRVFGLAPKVLCFDRAGLEKRMVDVGFEILEKKSFGKDKSTHFLIAKK